MLFTSYNFLLFLIAVFILYYLIPRRFQWGFLLAVSYLFYCFAGVKFIVYIFATTVSTYLIARKIGGLINKQTDYLLQNKTTLSKDESKNYKAAMKSRQKRWIVLCLLINFGILAVLKYSNFAILNINALISLANPEFGLTFVNFALPLGISFYTFQSMGYLIDVFRQKSPCEKNFFKFALFISFFPQLIQGPISRFDDLKTSLFEGHSYNQKNITFGLQRILWGYFKKLLIADRLAAAVHVITGDPQNFSGIYVVIGMFFYAMQLYTDFSGGIDITIGAAEVMGINLRENFNRPFFSKSIAEYWRRWHITLGTWFKDYMFYPISVSKPVTRFSKMCRERFGNVVGKRAAVYCSTIVIWFTTGIWHGASWNFVVWGLLNAFVILVSHECTPFYDKFHKKFHLENKFAFRLFQVVRTFWLMCFLRTLDCYPGVGNTFKMIGSVFTKPNLLVLFNGGVMKLGLSVSDYIVAGIAILILLSVSLLQRSGSIRDKLSTKPLMVRYSINFAMFACILIFGAYGVGYNAAQFIYSQF